ncbi:conserved Plasmodium protein, unknown function [Plasmodium vinckei vinckei]|uniref:Uncharacterized protein n=1 Tax=Plasmodium vinckei vinckei TaxID=54757 RepID=A0A449C0L4_PLAVN|nr:conserved Plasmodium protein, unknown function [Plasmodium vinckei vinckei]VEV59220.1 conserved Plasmodium protein, unknown function [Plasmodium vinckei vinckei]
MIMNSYEQHKWVVKKMSELKERYNIGRYLKFKNNIRYINTIKGYKNVSYMYLFFIFTFFSVKYLFFFVIFFLFYKYVLYNFVFFLYKQNLKIFNVVLKQLSICEYGNIVTLDQNHIIIDEIYSKIYKIINSILYIHFYFMKNPFSYFFHHSSISVDQLVVSCKDKNERLNKSKGNNLKRLYLLKDIYFNIYIMLYQLKPNKSNSWEENEKENVYKNIRQIFKVKYKNDYKMMKTNSNDYIYIFFLYTQKLGFIIIKRLFCFFHFFIFSIIFIWYLLKSYLFLLFYKKVIKKNNKLICLQNHEYIGSINISQTNKEVATLLIDSLILLKSEIQNDEQANIIYESVHKKLYDSINLVKDTKKVIENEMKKGKEVKSKKIEKVVENIPITEHVDDQSNKLNNSPPVIDNEVYKTSDSSYYHIYYCVNKEIETKNSYINNDSGKNISTHFNKYNEHNEKPESNTNPSIIQNQHEHIITYKNCLDKKYDENYKLMCVQNMVNELKDKYKKQKNKEYIYVEKKLYYDDKCNDFSIKHISSNDAILSSNTENIYQFENKNNDYNKCNMDIYTNTKYATPNNTENVYQFENKNNGHNDNNESSNPSLLTPIKDPKSFRNKITMSLKQRGGNLRN